MNHSIHVESSYVKNEFWNFLNHGFKPLGRPIDFHWLPYIRKVHDKNSRETKEILRRKKCTYNRQSKGRISIILAYAWDLWDMTPKGGMYYRKKIITLRNVHVQAAYIHWRKRKIYHGIISKSHSLANNNWVQFML